MPGPPAEDAALAALAAEAAGRMAAPDLASELGDARDVPMTLVRPRLEPALGSPAPRIRVAGFARGPHTSQPAAPREAPPEEEPAGRSRWARISTRRRQKLWPRGTRRRRRRRRRGGVARHPDTVDALMTPAAAEGDGAATMAAAAMAVAAAVGPLPASPANGASLPPSPPPASGSASSSACRRRRVSPWTRRSSGVPSMAAAAAGGGGCDGHDERCGRSGGKGGGVRAPGKAPRGNAAGGGGRRVPLWVLMALVAALVGRVVWVAAGFTPSAIRERIEAERRRHDPNRPIMGPRGPAYRVPPDDTAGGTPDAAEVSTPRRRLRRRRRRRRRWRWRGGAVRS